jgi:SAM-dependent methyltransferase
MTSSSTTTIYAPALQGLPAQHEGSDLWARGFARLYDRLFERGEEQGMAERRGALLARAEGRTVEIGAGTGLNVEHYPDGVDLLLSEPDPYMAAQLRERAAGRYAVAHAHAELLPVTVGSVDTVVSTFVLCTVPQPRLALDEASRILRPGGQLLFAEHVHAGEGTPLGRWQDRLVRPWKAFGRGCHPNRHTEQLVRDHPSFELAEVERAEWTGMLPLVRPIVIGRAVRA